MKKWALLSAGFAGSDSWGWVGEIRGQLSFFVFAYGDSDTFPDELAGGGGAVAVLRASISTLAESS